MKTDSLCMEREVAVRNALDLRIQHLLERLESTQVCSEGERLRLYRIVFAIQLTLKEAYDNLREIRSSLGQVAYHLQMHPTWLCGLLNLVDAMIAQVEGEKTESYGALLDIMNVDIKLLINASHRYHLARYA